MPTKQIDTTFDIEAAAGEPQQVVIQGHTFTLVDEPPVGALVVFTRRLQSKDIQDQLASILELAERWITPEDHDPLYDLVGGLTEDGLREFVDTDIARLVEAVAARPTSAQSS